MSSRRRPSLPLGYHATTTVRVSWDLILLVILCGLFVAFVAGCSSSGDTPTDDAAEPVDDVDQTAVAENNRAATSSPRRYVAEWLVDAQAIGLEVFGANPYSYVEVIDDREGTYLALGPEHLARQTRDDVVFCAGVYAPAPTCASIERPRGVPDIQSIAVTKVREWAPGVVYQLADLQGFVNVAATDPEAWQTRTGVHLGLPVRCFTAIGPNPSAPVGFDICITDDEYELIATLDLQGDVYLDISLERFDTMLTEFDLSLPADVTSDADVFDQLVYIYPQVPDIVLIDPDAESEDDGGGSAGSTAANAEASG